MCACLVIGGNKYIILGENQILKIFAFDSDNQVILNNLSEFQLEENITSISVGNVDNLCSIVLIVTLKYVWYLWLPSLKLNRSYPKYGISSSDVMCFVPGLSNIILSSKFKFYDSTPIIAACEDISFIGEALKVQIELGSLTQLVPSEDDVVTRMIPLSLSSSSLLIMFQSLKTGLYSVRWCDIELKIMKMKWILNFNSLTIAATSVDSEFSTKSVGIIAANQSIYVVNGNGILSELKLWVDNSVDIVGLTCLNTVLDNLIRVIISSSDGEYHNVIISKTTRSLMESNKLLQVTSDDSDGQLLLPCSEYLSVVTYTPTSSILFGSHSSFGYQLMNITFKDSKDVTTGVVENVFGKLCSCKEVISMRENLFDYSKCDSLLAVCSSSLVDKSMLFLLERNCKLVSQQSFDIDDFSDTDKLSLMALSLRNSDDNLLMLTSAARRQSSLISVNGSTGNLQLIESDGKSYVSNEVSLGLFELLNESIVQITPTVLTVMKYSKGVMKFISSLTITEVICNKNSNYWHVSETGVRKMSKQETVLYQNEFRTKCVDRCILVGDLLALSCKQLLILVKLSTIHNDFSNVEADVISFADEISSICGINSDHSCVLCVACWESKEIQLLLLSKESIITSLGVISVDAASGNVIRYMQIICPLVSSKDFAVVCGTMEGGLVLLDIEYDKAVKTHSKINKIASLPSGIHSIDKISNNSLIVVSGTNNYLLSYSKEWTMNPIACAKCSRSHVPVKVNHGDGIGWLNNNGSLHIGLLEYNCESRFIRKYLLNGIVISVDSINKDSEMPKLLVLFKNRSNVHHVALIDYQLTCLWTHCIDSSNKTPCQSKEYRLVTGPKPTVKVSVDSVVFSLVSFEGMAPLVDISPEYSKCSAGNIVITTYSLSKRQEWSLATIGCVVAPYIRPEQWTSNAIQDLFASYSVSDSTLVVTAPTGRLVVLGWSDNKNEIVSVLSKLQDKEKQHRLVKGGNPVLIPKRKLKLDLLAEITLETTIRSVCCSNGKFIYAIVAGLGIDILMLKERESLESQSEYLLETVLKVRDMPFYSKLCGVCVESSHNVTVADKSIPSHSFQIMSYDSGGREALLISFNIPISNLQDKSEPMETNIKPSISKIECSSSLSISYVEPCVSTDRPIKFRCFDTNGCDVLVDIV